MKIRPTHDRILISPVKQDEVSKGGIVIPEGARRKPNKGVVMAVGPGIQLEDGTHRQLSVKVGNLVLHDNYAGTKVEDTDYILVNDSDILAVLEG